MNNESQWAVLNVRLSRMIPLAVATATIGFASPASAAGTAAGTTISNTATATYNDAGNNPQTVNSNQVNLRVDELLNVTVTRVGSGDVPTTPGSTNQVQVFTVTNTGNGSEAFTLSAQTALGGDQFDPTTAQIYFDTNNNGLYDAGVDTLYTAGSNDRTLTPDETVQVLVLATIPAGTNNNDRGQLNLTAAANTGTGSPGTTFAGAGQGGGDAVVGSSGADDVASGFYIVQNATVSFIKSQSVADPFGGVKVVPGSVITYTLVATVSGSGSLSNLLVSDGIPLNTTYEAGTITLQGSPLTDAADADGGQVNGSPVVTSVQAAIGSVPAGQTRTIIFKVKVK
jgi:uncharacterized repeat protein (TIGR01451 family)